MADIEVINHGTVFGVHPQTDEGRAWLEKNLSGEVTQIGGSVFVEHRYTRELVAGMRGDGLAVIGAI